MFDELLVALGLNKVAEFTEKLTAVVEHIVFGEPLKTISEWISLQGG